MADCRLQEPPPLKFLFNPLQSFFQGKNFLTNRRSPLRFEVKNFPITRGSSLRFDGGKNGKAEEEKLKTKSAK